MRDDRERLLLIIRLIDLVESELDGVVEKDFLARPGLIDAAAHRVMHIAENAKHLDTALKERHSLPWAAIAGMRNIIAHDYEAINLTVLWSTIQNQLAPLRAVCVAETGDPTGTS